MPSTPPAPGFPLPLRNALAELAIAALDDDVAAAAVAWVAAPDGAPPPAVATRLAAAHLVDAGTDRLLDVHAPWADAAAAHARRALAARATFRAGPPPPTDPVPAALARAVALWNQRLFFEVHEVLEAEWKRVAGDVRTALQGLIQIGVAFHHLAHGNLRGARSLLRDGRERLAATAAAVPTVDARALLDATAAFEAATARGETPAQDPPPLRRA